MFDDHTCMAFSLFSSFFLSLLNRCQYVYISFFDAFFLCCTDVKLWGTRTIRTLDNSALVNSDPILFGPSQFGL